MDITDKEIIDKYYRNTCMLYRKMKYNMVSEEEINYLKNRYDDCDDIYEAIYRIKNNIDVVPKCPVCGKKIKFDFGHKMFNKFCSKECAHKYCADKMHKGVFEKYGVKSTMQLKEVREKSKKTWKNKSPEEIRNFVNKGKETKLKLYGDPNYCNTNKIKEKWKNKSDKDLKEIYKKKKKTYLKHYGVENYTKTNEWRKHASEISDEVKKKAYETMKRNGNLCHKNSKAENECYELLKEIYPEIKRQYMCDKYPWRCDFYVPNKNLLIEYQGYFTHGEHQFNSNNIDDIKRLNELKEKYKSYYDKNGCWPQIITIWTEKDVEKRNTAIKNGFNYLEFYNLNQVKDYVKSIK